jgi:hypothetical protein
LRRLAEELIGVTIELKRGGHGNLQPAVHSRRGINLIAYLHVYRGGGLSRARDGTEQQRGGQSEKKRAQIHRQLLI